MKELELEDRQYEVDKELGDLSTAGQLTKTEEERFEELCELKIKIVEERHEVVMQTEDERRRCVWCGGGCVLSTIHYFVSNDCLAFNWVLFVFTFTYT